MTASNTLSVKEAAQEMGCTITYIFQLLWAGRLEGATKQGKRWCIPVSAIEERLARRQALQ